MKNKWNITSKGLPGTPWPWPSSLRGRRARQRRCSSGCGSTSSSPGHPRTLEPEQETEVSTASHKRHCYYMDDTIVPTMDKAWARVVEYCELVSLTGQKLIRIIMLFGEMPLHQGGAMSICAFKQCRDGTTMKTFHELSSIKDWSWITIFFSTTMEQCENSIIIFLD